MKKLLISIGLVSSVMLSGNSFGQQDEQQSFYMFNTMAYNPAYAGSRNTLSISSFARLQWIGIKGAPQTQWLSAHAPVLGDNLGLGINLVNDRIGNTQRTSIAGNVAGSIKIAKNGARLSIGLSPKIDFLNFDASSVNANDIGDPTVFQSLNVGMFNVGAGLYLHQKNYYLGVSSPRLLERSVSTNQSINFQTDTRHFYLLGGYVFHVNPMFDIKPSFLVKATPNVPMAIDMNISFLLNKRLWLGGMYRLNKSVGANVIYSINNTFSLGYAAEFQVSNISRAGNSSHEIMLLFDLNRSKNNSYSPRYF